MKAANPHLAACLTVLLVSLPATRGNAGIRVTSPLSPQTAPTEEFQPWSSFHLGLGVTGGDTPTATGGAIGLEAALWRNHHVLLRVDHFRFSENESAGAGTQGPSLMTLDGSFTTAQAGIRLGAERATARAYVDALAGLGFIESVVSIGPYAFGGDDVRAVLGTGLGASWVPQRSPVGGFAEVRLDLLLGPPSGNFHSVRAGLTLRGPKPSPRSFRSLARDPELSARDSVAFERGRSISRVRSAP